MNVAPLDTSSSSPLKTTLILFSALSFLGYGLGCFFSAYQKAEFQRYQLSNRRNLVGILQCAAALGLIAGLVLNLPWIGQAAAGGLALMMLVALGVRVRIKDGLVQMLPATGYLALNAYLCIAGF